MFNPKLAGLLKYATMGSADLTTDALKDIASAFGYEIDPSEAMLGQVTALLKSDDIDKLADLASRPDVFNKIIPLIKPPEPEGVDMIVCPHCNGFVLLD